uniref:Uncharacterized protein n=1 Tax=Phlebotomus papatasi TaxID=29031 RepID=A0A1B0D1Y7_PHLPP
MMNAQIPENKFSDVSDLLESFFALNAQIVRKLPVAYSRGDIDCFKMIYFALKALVLPESGPVKYGTQFLSHFIMQSRQFPNMTTTVIERGGQIIQTTLLCIAISMAGHTHLVWKIETMRQQRSGSMGFESFIKLSLNDLCIINPHFANLPKDGHSFFHDKENGLGICGISIFLLNSLGIEGGIEGGHHVETEECADFCGFGLTAILCDDLELFEARRNHEIKTTWNFVWSQHTHQSSNAVH